MRATLLLLSCLAAASAAYAGNVTLPSNVTLRPGNMSGDYIDTVTQSLPGAEFAKLKMCVAESVSNAPATLTGGTDAPLAFYSNRRTETQAVGGGDTFKYVDDAAEALIAIGTTEGGSIGLSGTVVRFEVKATSTPEAVTLRFTNISRASLNTGSVTNSGFTPVGAWKGAKPQAVIDSLQRVAGTIGACLR